MCKEKYVWLLFISLTLLTVACSDQARSEGEMYDANQIREELSQLDHNSDIIYGKEIFDDTKSVVPDHVGNELSCLSCHGDGGLAPNSPMVGITKKFPKMRRGKLTTIEDRINGCFVRSMNGDKLEEDSREMKAMVAYFEFISKDVESKKDITWRMNNDKKKVPEPDLTNGARLFVEKNCVSCHATDGSGTSDQTGPALWGDGSFNEAAGMTKIEKATGFIQNNMPKGKEGTLTDQEAADIAAFLLSHERPSGDPEELTDYHLDPSRSYITKERREAIRNGNFDWTSLDVIVPKEKQQN
ncbi:c-type cytochrome [Virgibacillus halodenitrificans]|uniref:c-type cytochrome n=1 Tax=Virgibacillus halodenitrificans TaxID=1482 RepID=UPI00136AB23B|nr:c-type cytochrome [Virgibacillus halodenitrificans]